MWQEGEVVYRARVLVERPAQEAAVTARLRAVISACQLLTNLLQPEVEVDVNVR